MMPDILDGTLSVCIEATLALLGRLICCCDVLLQNFGPVLAHTHIDATGCLLALLDEGSSRQGSLYSLRPMIQVELFQWSQVVL